MIYASNKQTHGGLESFDYTIIIAADLPVAYERFVVIKELMHCYFAPIEKNVKYFTSSQIALQSHMNVFFGNSTAASASSKAETMALWMALGVICTEHDRRAMEVRLKAKTLNFTAVADQLRIPLRQAKALFANNYEAEIASLIA